VRVNAAILILVGAAIAVIGRASLGDREHAAALKQLGS
jgi:hypothetical protein